jgi:excisionase family DNA binding protein
MVKVSATRRRSQIMEATSGKSEYWSPHRSPYLTVKQAEEYTTLHRVTLWRAVRLGRLQVSGYGRAVRYHVKDLDEFMTSRNRK